MFVSLLLATTTAHATVCTPWDAGFAATRAVPKGSQALSYRWTGVGDCDGFTLHHYEVCWNDGEFGSGPLAPESPQESGASCTSYGGVGAATSGKEFVYRSYRSFGVRVFACADEDCSSWYGDGSVGSDALDDAGSVATAKERWVFEDILDYADSDRAIDDATATAADALFYGTDFTAAGRLGLWYTATEGGASVVRQVTADVTGWQNWNLTSSWGTSLTVASAAREPEGYFGGLSRAWVAPADDGSAYVRLFLEMDDDGDPGSGAPTQVWSVDSVDDAGRNFALQCVGSDCSPDGALCPVGGLCDWEDDGGDGGAAVLEIGGEGGEEDAWLTMAGGGRVLFGWLDDENHAVDFDTDSPVMLFNGASACAYGTYAATWDGSAWQVPTDGSCPEPLSTAGVDPAVVELPNGEFKVYLHTASGYDVCIYGDEGLEACAPVDFAFDNGTALGRVDPSLAACTSNLDVTSLKAGNSTFEGGFVAAATDSGCFSSGGIAFLEHRN